MGGPMYGEGFGVIGVVIQLAIVVLFLWMASRVVGRAGYNPWWALIMLVPLLNLVMIWVFAFAEWPALKGRQGGGGMAARSQSVVDRG